MALFGIQSHPGSWQIGGIRLPDFGITERVQSLINPQASFTPEGGSNLRGNYYPQQSFAQPSPQVLGVANPPGGGFQSLLPQNTPAPGSSRGYNPGGGGLPGGGGGGGGDSGAMIPTPQAPQIDYNALVQPAIQALEQAMAPQQTAYQANVADINATTGAQRGQVQEQQAAQQGQISAARASQQTQAENAMSQARRSAAEIQQGIQARYGGTTGTGAFASEIAGSQAQRNIGMMQQNLTNALAHLDDTSLRVNQITNQALNDIENSRLARIQQAKSGLESNLNQIRLAQGELQSRKAELAFNATQHYMDTVNQVNAANAAFKQNLVLEHQRIQGLLDLYRGRGVGAMNSTFGGLPTNYNINQTNPLPETPQTGDTQQNLGTNPLLAPEQKKYIGGLPA